MPKYLKVCLMIIVASIALPIILFGACVSTMNHSESIAVIFGFIFIAAIFAAPVAILGSLIAMTVCYIKNKKGNKKWK